MDINGFMPQGKPSTRSLLSIKDLSQEDIFEILHLTRQLQTKVKFKEQVEKLNGQNVLFIGKNSHGKTRICFEIATRSLQANPLVIPLKGSHIEDLLANDLTVKVISSFGLSAIVVDTEQEVDSEYISKNISAPVINACDNEGPIQILSALFTLWERFGRLANLKVAVCGSVNEKDLAVCAGFAKCGLNLTIISPEEEAPNAETFNYLKQFTSISYTDELSSGIKNADVIYFTKTAFENYYLTEDLLLDNAPNAYFMHVVPLEREVQADNEVIDGKNSLVLKHGENTLNVLRSAIYLYSTK